MKVSLHLFFKGAHLSPWETVRHCESQVICSESYEMQMVRTMLDNTLGTTMMKWKWVAAAVAAAAASGSGKYAGQSPSYLVSLPLLQSNHCILLFIKFSISNPSYKKPILCRIRTALLFVNHPCLVTKMSIETYHIFPPFQGICCILVNHFNGSHNSVCWRFTEAVS